MRRLARFVNDLLEREQTSVSEAAAGSLTLHRVSAGAVIKLAELVREIGWEFEITDSSDAVVQVEYIDDYFAPFHIAIEKTAAPGEILFISSPAFEQWISEPQPATVVRVVDSTSSFSTETFSVVAFEDGVPNIQQAGIRKSPLAIVKCIGECSSLPSDVRPYLLTEDSATPWGDVAFEIWTRISIRRLMCALATEVHATTKVVEFSGPPRVVLTSTDGASPSALGVSGFLDLQTAAKWVYSVDREAETRHRLFAIEFSRSIENGMDVSLAFKEAASSALDGARIAHSFGLLELSQDSLKAMADLRKSVADDTSKLSESMRQLSLSVAGALFYGLAIVAAKIASTVNPLVLDVMAIVGAAYVGVIVWVNYTHMVQQRALRANWRSKFYKFLRSDDYASMVETPIGAAEKSLRLSMVGASILTAISCAAVIASNH